MTPTDAVNQVIVALETDMANARLIAAAPDLLEALCLAHDYLAGNGWDDDPRLDTIRAAIAKATGGEG